VDSCPSLVLARPSYLQSVDWLESGFMWHRWALGGITVGYIEHVRRFKNSCMGFIGLGRVYAGRLWNVGLEGLLMCTSLTGTLYCDSKSDESSKQQVT
jgi:hypothetical protein